jgi:hypothetical protein
MAKEKQEPVAEAVPDSEAHTLQLEKISFHLAILQPDGSYVTESFETLPEIVARLKDLVDKDVAVYSFVGTRMHISKPPFRHLLTPWGNHPLYDVPEALEPDDTGYLGVDPIGLSAPAEIKPPAASRQSHTQDIFSDGGGVGLGVFDDVLPHPDSSG